MDCSTRGLPVLHQLPEFTQTHVHRVGDAIQPSPLLVSPSPPAFGGSINTMEISKHYKSGLHVCVCLSVWQLILPAAHPPSRAVWFQSLCANEPLPLCNQKAIVQVSGHACMLAWQGLGATQSANRRTEVRGEARKGTWSVKICQKVPTQ